MQGWSIESDDKTGEWRWSVFTSNGTRKGTGTNFLNCENQVDQAIRELGAPRPSNLDDALRSELR
jgi:hypothetical protein